VTTAA